MGPYPRYAEGVTEKAFKVWMASRENDHTVKIAKATAEKAKREYDEKLA